LSSTAAIAFLCPATSAKLSGSPLNRLNWLPFKSALTGADIPDDPEIDVDLTGPDYFFSPKGQIQLEPKDAMKARGLDSPDIGDCLAMSHSVKVLARKPDLKPVYTYPCLSDTARWMH
jgi:hypothetical protein